MKKKDITNMLVDFGRYIIKRKNAIVTDKFVKYLNEGNVCTSFNCGEDIKISIIIERKRD